jgi:hypothetical protein
MVRSVGQDPGAAVRQFQRGPDVPGECNAEGKDPVRDVPGCGDAAVGRPDGGTRRGDSATGPRGDGHGAVAGTVGVLGIRQEDATPCRLKCRRR